MAGCNWAFGCAIALFVIILILILVIVVGGGDDSKDKIVIMPGTPAAAAPASSVSAPVARLRMENNGMKELNSAAEAEQLLNSKTPTLVLFYGNFCGHCKKMMPDFEQAAAEIAQKMGIVVARVESGSMKDMAACKLPSITGFPTMVTNYEGGLKTHVGRMDKSAIVALMQKPGAGAGHGARNSCGASNNAMAMAMANSHGAADAGAMAAANGKKPVPAKPARKMVEFQSFDDVCNALQSDQKTIVMAYADWCGFCKTMKPDYEELLKQAPADVVIGRVNADNIKNLKICEGKHGPVDVINAYPTILFNNGKGIMKTMGRQTLKTLLEMVAEKKAA